MQSGNAPTLQDRTTFWLGLGGLLAVVGGIPVAVVPTTLPQHLGPWSSGWFEQESCSCFSASVAPCGR
jgi:hypothetical protein